MMLGIPLLDETTMHIMYSFDIINDVLLHDVLIFATCLQFFYRQIIQILLEIIGTRLACHRTDTLQRQKHE